VAVRYDGICGLGYFVGLKNTEMEWCEESGKWTFFGSKRVVRQGENDICKTGLPSRNATRRKSHVAVRDGTRTQR
jgi:hypothetical protein